MGQAHGQVDGMKVAILAGGKGERLGSGPDGPPKALLDLGGRPLIWHVMALYHRQGFSEFVVALGYKGEQIRDFFAPFRDGRRPLFPGGASVRVNLVETGQDTQTGGRIKRLAPWVGDGTFMLTWCDGLGDLDIPDLVAFHRLHGRAATLSAVHPPSQFGHLHLDSESGRVVRFREKPTLEDVWINGAFFVLEPRVLELIEGDATHWETGPLRRLSEAGELMAYRHHGFWQNVDTRSDLARLQALVDRGNRPWVVEHTDHADLDHGARRLHRFGVVAHAGS